MPVQPLLKKIALGAKKAPVAAGAGRDSLKSHKKHNTPASEKFDRELFASKLSQLSSQMQEKISAREADTLFWEAPTALLDSLASYLFHRDMGLLHSLDNPLHIALLREWLEGIDRVCREVWQIQGEAVTPEFVRCVLEAEAMTFIRPREAKAKSNLADIVSQLSRLPDARHLRRQRTQTVKLLMGLNKLKAEVSNRYEIEVRTLEYQTKVGANQAVSFRVESANRKGQSAESKPVDRGKFCVQVIGEIRIIKNLAQGSGRSVAEIENEHPDFAVWKVRTSLSLEDQETFSHPNQWGPPVGYAKMVLSKIQGVRTHTINSWVKAYRKRQKAKKA